MPNPENLTPFQPGQSGNPNGRPKGAENSATRLRRLLEFVQKKKNLVTGETEEFTVLEQMDMAIVAKAIKGNLAEYREILDRLEGKSTQTFEHSGKDGKDLMPANVLFITADRLTDEQLSKYLNKDAGTDNENI